MTSAASPELTLRVPCEVRLLTAPLVKEVFHTKLLDLSLSNFAYVVAVISVQHMQILQSNEIVL